MADLFQIGTVAEQVGLSLRTIRFYEEAGIVSPSARSAGGFRLYTRADMERLLEVKALKPLGFSLDETRRMMSLRDRLRSEGALDPEAQEELMAFARRARDQFDKRKRQLADAQRLTAALESELAGIEPPAP